MDSRQDHYLRPSFPENKKSKNNANGIPPGFGLFDYNRNNSPSNTSSSSSSSPSNNMPSISNSQSLTSSTSRYKLNYFPYLTKPTNRTSEPSLVNAFNSLTFNPKRERNPVQKSYGLKNQNYIPSVYNISAAEFKRSRKQKLRLLFAENAELNFMNDNLSDLEINLESMKSIGIGPLCPPNPNSLFPLSTSIHELCEHLSSLSGERCAVESKILGQDYASKNHYPVLGKKGFWNQITYIKNLLFIEISVTLGFIREYRYCLDKEAERHTIILLNELERYTEKLTTFENLRIFHKHGEFFGGRSRVTELEQLLSEIISLVIQCIAMLFIIKHNGILPNSTRQCRNIFIG